MKIVNPIKTAAMRVPGKCRFCGNWCQLLCGHHIWSKGACQLDVGFNLIALGFDPHRDCPCHRQNHDGNEPTFEQLLALSAQDHDALQGDIETVFYLLRDQLPKGTTAEAIRRHAAKLNLGARRLLLRELEGFEHLLLRES